MGVMIIFYTEFVKKYGDKDYDLIKMSDGYPYFKEKLFHRDGKISTDTKYHIADNYDSTYIYYDFPDDAIIAAEISTYPSFEARCNYDHPIFVMNAGEKTFEVEYFAIGQGDTVSGYIPKDAVVAIYPKSLAIETISRLAEEYPECVPERISQSEINFLLSGIKDE